LRIGITFELDYLNLEQPFDRGLVALGDRPADIPITRFLGDPDDVYKLEEVGIGYRFEHRFNENIKLRNAFRFQESNTFDQKTQPGDLDEETGDFTRDFDSNDDRDRNYAVQTELVSEFATGSIEHNLLFGFDLARNEFGGTNNGLPSAPSINIFNPVYKVRNLAFALHRYIGLAVGSILIVSLTGSLLVFQKEETSVEKTFNSVKF
jgi:iron complex outermembrane recepter protein